MDDYFGFRALSASNPSLRRAVSKSSQGWKALCNFYWGKLYEQVHGLSQQVVLETLVALFQVSYLYF